MRSVVDRTVGMWRIPVVYDISDEPSPFILNGSRSDLKPLKMEAIGSIETSRVT
jgi:hypothetical protein